MKSLGWHAAITIAVLALAIELLPVLFGTGRVGAALPREVPANLRIVAASL